MSLSPYSKGSNKPVRVMTAARDVPVASQDGLRGGVQGRLSSGPAFNGAGELNASSKLDAMRQIGQIVQAASQQSTLARTETHEQAQERVAMLKEAHADKHGHKMQILGEVYSEEIWLSLGRDGFTRKLFAVQNVAAGQIPKVKVRKKDVMAWQVTTDVYIQESRIRQNYVYPPIFYLLCHILIEDKEIAMASPELLDEKFQDGLEAILRREDLITRQLLVAGATTWNDLTLYNQFTPAVLSNLRMNVARWGIPATTALISMDVWGDILSNPDFANWFDPVTKHELIMEGRLGSLLGLEILTDGFRTANLQVLQPGEVFVTGAPVTLGAVCQVKELDSTAVNKYAEGRPARGWFMEAIEGIVLANSRSVSMGRRV